MKKIYIVIIWAVLVSKLFSDPVPPTHKSIKYGPYERNVLDLYLAKTKAKSPLFLWIHGGGFIHGDKSSIAPPLVKKCLAAGISVASLNYRYSVQAIAPGPHNDICNAIQFIRYNADKWNIDKKRIAAGGGSAGSHLAQWIGFSDDMADPKSSDPIKKESTRVICLLLINSQTSNDPRFMKEHIPGTAYMDHNIAKLYDFDPKQSPHSLPGHSVKLIEDTSPMNLISKGDPPTIYFYERPRYPDVKTDKGASIHHPNFGFIMKEKMDTLGIYCAVYTKEDQKNWEWKFNYMVRFLTKKLEPVIE